MRQEIRGNSRGRHHFAHQRRQRRRLFRFKVLTPLGVTKRTVLREIGGSLLPQPLTQSVTKALLHLLLRYIHGSLSSSLPRYPPVLETYTLRRLSDPNTVLRLGWLLVAKHAHPDPYH